MIYLYNREKKSSIFWHLKTNVGNFFLDKKKSRTDTYIEVVVEVKR